MDPHTEANEINTNLEALKNEIIRNSRLSDEENRLLEQWFDAIDMVFSSAEDISYKCDMYAILNAMAKGGALLDPYTLGPNDRNQRFRPSRFTYKKLAFERKTLDHVKTKVADVLKRKQGLSTSVKLQNGSKNIRATEVDFDISPIELESALHDNTEDIFDPNGPEYRFIPSTVKNYVAKLVQKQPQTWPPVLNNVSNWINWVATKNISQNRPNLIDLSAKSR